MKRVSIAAARLASVFAVVLLASCSKNDSSPALATLSVTPGKKAVPLGSPVDLTYKFVIEPQAKIDGDYRVFVHVMDDRGQRMWTDDHDPPKPTSTWKAGETIQYTRTRFVPLYPFVGEATILMGLYRDDTRLPLAGIDPADRQSPARAYKAGTLELKAESENVLLIHKSGWHPVEFSPNDPAISWEWTEKAAVISLKNPKKDITFYLEYDARQDIFDGQVQRVSVYAGGQEVYTFAADQKDQTLERIPISAAQLGTDEMAEIRIEVDKSFVPAKLQNGGRDNRELGIRVYHAFVEVR
ncbi:MAG TPA: hypothetical protein VFO19_21085 [Vicinamibacterales bacterium]|nr:hypothetical protein [Vicinamibacterales bacterium]